MSKRKICNECGKRAKNGFLCRTCEKRIVKGVNRIMKIEFVRFGIGFYLTFIPKTRSLSIAIDSYRRNQAFIGNQDITIINGSRMFHFNI
jgi:hypothetical protein